MIWYVAIIAIVNLALGYILAVMLGNREAREPVALDWL